MAFELEHGSWSLVAVGSFNPAIFHPSWLELNGLVSSVEVASAKTEVVHPEIAGFSIAGLDWRVERARLSISTAISPEVRILDSMVRILTEILPHSPVNAIGINRTGHFSAGSFESRTALGRMLAPVEPWGRFGKDVENSDGELVGGMTNLVMRLQKKTENYTGFTDVAVEPSNVLGGNAGVFVAVNNHYSPIGDGAGSARSAAALLASEFDASNNYSDMIIHDLIEACR